ncbi:hemagglutinin repeat-containing protein [Pseudomonas leptonychotis]|uniref:Filamentous hemagglutinin N-terminal domain-containing protein n=1 Tax=Pseudomonas leptonychotis TaxID=2448482 RepID=A0A4T2A1J0_9PSED|nr:hemagglutinin repeat-containing protein [Pseudomonas leptonychotis]TIH10895.1 filamentous hemagglutinin N-terminal domain-containing protein [Pseudomonas leptonychotis]
MDVRTPFFQNIASVLIGVLFLNPIVATAAELALDAQAGGNASLGQAGNGVPVVNIATPNGSGLSHNTFSDFNVGQQGLILNNTTDRLQSTQLGGIIVGNSNLKDGAANLILNEVTGSNTSQLRGYTEVAGKSAAVIVANPHGITCDGCGFINTPRVTLSTGRPVIEGGRLDRFDVNSGQINIEGSGLNASNIEQFDLITRSAKINAELYANKLNVITGRNQVKADDLAVTAKTDDGSAKPLLAIDSSALGGMYAGAIRLVGSEAGVGVKLAGNMAASAGDIQIDANGKLSMAQAAASRDIRLTGESIALTSKAYAGRHVDAQAQQGLTLAQGQSLAARDSIKLKGGQLDNQGLIEAGVNADNSRNLNGDITLIGGGLRNSGSVIASRELSSTVGGLLDNRAGTLSGKANTNLTAAGLSNGAEGRIVSQGNLTVGVDGLDNRGGLIASANGLRVIAGGDVHNQGGEISSQASVTLEGRSLNNQGGLIAAKQHLSIDGKSLDNRGGQVSGKADLSVSVDTVLDNRSQGTVVADGKLTLDAAELRNGDRGQVAAKGDLAISVGELSQQGDVATTAGELLSQGKLTLVADSIDNRKGGLIAASKGLDISASKLLRNGGGEISTQGQASVLVKAAGGQPTALLDNSGAGTIIGDQGLTLTVQRLLNNAKGLLAGRDSLVLIGDSLDNRDAGTLSSQQALSVQLTGELQNQIQGALLSGGSLTVNAASLNNSAGGLLSSATKLEVGGGSLSNQGGKLVSDGQLTISNSRLDNSNSGIISAKQALTIGTGQLDNQSKGLITSGAGLKVTAGQINNYEQGLIAAKGDAQVTATGLDQHASGELISEAALSLDLQGGALNNSGKGLIATPGALLLNNLGALNNSAGGEISSSQSFLLKANQLNNSAGRVISGQHLQVQITQALLNNLKGVLSAAKLTVAAASLDNSAAGVLASKGDIQVSLTGKLDNHDQGVISAVKALTVASASLDNSNNGLLASGGALQLDTGAANNQGGSILSQAELDVSTVALDNRGGVLSSQQALTLSAGAIDNRDKGLITSTSQLTLSAASLDSSRDLGTSGGEVSAKQRLQLTVNKLIQQQGRLIGEAGVSIDFKGGDLDNRGGLLSATGSLTLHNLGKLDNRNAGEISSSQSYSLNASAIDNGEQGRLISAGNLNLDLGNGNLRNAAGGLISGWQGLAVKAGNLDNSVLGTLSSRNGALTVELSGSERVLNNSGEGALVSKGTLSVDVGSLNNSGKGILSSEGDLELSLSGALNNNDGGLIDSQGALSASAGAVNNHSGQIGSLKAASLTASSLDNSAGQLSSNAALTLTLAGNLINTQQAKLASAGPLVLKAQAIDNQGGSLVSQNLLNITGSNLNNANGGTVAARSGLTLLLTGALNNSADGLIHSEQGALDISAQSLNNNGGALSSQQNLTLNLNAKLDNQSGRIESLAGNLDLQKSTAVDNSAGVLSSIKGWLKLVTAGLFDNDAGTTQAQSLAIDARGVDNRGGHISALSGNTVIDSGSATFNNQNGGLYAHQLLKVIAGNFNNQGAVQGEGGKVAADRIDFSLSGALNNSYGILESASTLKLAAASINNRYGSLRALGTSGDTRIVASSLDNRNGKLETANTNLDLNVASLQSSGGSILHVGTGDFGLSAAQVTGAGGDLSTNGLLTLTADNWTNSGVLQAGQLVLNIGNFTQTASGQLLAGNSFSGSGGNWVNHGLLASDGNFSLNLSGAYSGNGQVTSLGDLTLSAGSIDLSSSARIAGGGLTNVSAGLLSNFGKLTAAGDLTVTANTLNNRGTLGSAEKLRLVAPTLLNENGLIFSGDDMTLRVNNFTNRYADVYSLGELNIAANDQLARSNSVENISAAIESGGDMMIFSNSIINKKERFDTIAELKSGAIGVRCYSCSSSVAGYAGLSSHLVWIENFTAKVLQDSPSSIISAGRNFTTNSTVFLNSNSSVSAVGDLEINTDLFENSGSVLEDFSRRRYIDIKPGKGLWQEIVDYNSYNDAAYNKSIHFWNSSDQESMVKPSIVEHGGKPVDRELYQYFGTMRLSLGPSYASAARKNAVKLSDSRYSSGVRVEAPVAIKNATPFSDLISVGNSSSHSAAVVQAGGKVVINAKDKIVNGVQLSGVTAAVPGSRVGETKILGSGITKIVQINSQLPPDLRQSQINPISLSGFSLPQGVNGLFRLSGQGGTGSMVSATPSSVSDYTSGGSSIALGSVQAAQGVGAVLASNWSMHNIQVAGGGSSLDSVTSQVVGVQSLPRSVLPSVSHKYLIETNPELTSLKQFLGSDYMLGNLGYDPDQAQKRLGDGLYEQRLIREAVVARTGQRFLAGLNSDEAMFRHLMDNAIASKQALKLSVGISLSAEQVAALTHDIVWLEEYEVAGEKVLVPVLYLAQAEGRLAPNGALIQGQDVALISGGGLLNQGTLRASNNLSAVAGGSISNRGLIAAGNRLDLLATDSIRNAQGGVISGRDVSLIARTGDVLNERTVTRQNTSIGNRQYIKDYVDSASRIEAANSLEISAGRDVANLGGILDSRGDLSLIAGRDVTIASVEERNLQTRGSRYRRESVSQHGAQVSAGRDIEISAGRDLTAIASRIDAQRDIKLDAGQDVTLAAAANESHSYSKSKKVTRSADLVLQQASSVQAGRDISIDAGKDLTVVASHVKAGNDIALDAQQDINILSAKNESASFYSKKSKGSFGRSKSEQKEKYDSTNIASVIDAGNDLTINTSKAVDGSMSIDGGRDVTVIGSQLKASNDLLVGATGDIAVLSGVEEHGSYSKKTKSGFLGLSKSGKSQLKTTASQVSSELDAGNDVVIAAGNDIRLRASETTAGNDVELRAGLVTDTGDINLVSANDTAYSLKQEYKQKFGASLSGGMLSFASAKKAGQEAQSSTSVGSQVSADRDATLNAERDINIIGSGVSAGRNVALGAGRDVNVLAASSSSTDKAWEESQRIGIALGMKSSSPYTSEEERIYVGDAYEATKNVLGVTTQSVAPSLIHSGEDMTVNAGRDIQVKGSQLLAGGDASLDAGRDIRISSSTHTVDVAEKDQTQNYGGGLLKSPAKGPAGIGVMHDVDYLDGYNRATQQSEIYSAISAEGDLSLKSGRDTEIAGGNLVADNVSIDAGRDIRIDSPENKDILYRDVMQGGVGLAVGLRPHEENAGITSPSIQPSSIVATDGDISLRAGQDVKIQGASLLAQRDVVIDAVRDAHLSGASVSVDNHNNVVSNSMASVDRTDTDFNSTASAPLQIQAGRDVSIQAGRDIVARNLLAEAGRDIDIIAGRDLTIGATQRERSTGSNSLGIKGDMFGLGEMARAFSEGKSGAEILSAAAQANPLLNNINNIAKTDNDEDKWQNAAVLGYRLYSGNPSAGSGESTGASTAASYGFDLSRGINGRLGYQRSQSEWNEQSGSQLAAGRDLYLEAGQDLALVDGTQASAVREAYLVGGRDIIIRSAENASKERSSGGGITVGYNGGWYGGLDGNSSRGDSAQYQNASVTAGQTLVTDSGRDTIIIGGNLHGGDVEMSVGRNLALISQQGTIDQQSSSASFTVGSSYSFNASASERDRQAVDRPATITADDRLRIDVAQNTHLKGSQIDSGTGNLELVTETLSYEDLKNHDRASQGSVSYSGSSDGDTWGNGGEAQEGNGFSAGVPIANLEGGDTRAAIGKGVIRNHAGEELDTDISRDVAGAHKETDSAAISEYSAKSELLGIAAQEGYKAVGDYATNKVIEAEFNAAKAEAAGNATDASYWRSQADAWKDGGANRVLMHAALGALLGEASGFGAAAGGVSAAANQALNSVIYDLLKEQGAIAEGDAAGEKKLRELTAVLVGGIVGGATGGGGLGAAVALTADKYNRQLHPLEKALLESKAKALEKDLGTPSLEGYTWTELLALAAGAEVDATKRQQYVQLLASISGPSETNNPLRKAFQRDMDAVLGTLVVMASSSMVLTWEDGSPVIAHGKPVYAFQATEEQFQDSRLFSNAFAVAQAGRGGQSVEWIHNEFDAETLSKHYLELYRFTESPHADTDLPDRLSWSVLDAIKPDTTDFDLATLGLGSLLKAGFQGGKGLTGALIEILAKREGAKATGTAGKIKIEPGAIPDANEVRAGQGLSGLGYDVTHQTTASAKGVQGQRTADLHIDGLGSIDVYTPKNLDPTKIVRAIEKKSNQAGGVLVQADLPSTDMSSIAVRMWGKTNAQSIKTIFFQKPDGSLVRFDRPAGGG